MSTQTFKVFVVNANKFFDLDIFVKRLSNDDPSGVWWFGEKDRNRLRKTYHFEFRTDEWLNSHLDHMTLRQYNDYVSARISPKEAVLVYSDCHSGYLISALKQSNIPYVHYIGGLFNVNVSGKTGSFSPSSLKEMFFTLFGIENANISYLGKVIDESIGILEGFLDENISKNESNPAGADDKSLLNLVNGNTHPQYFSQETVPLESSPPSKEVNDAFESIEENYKNYKACQNMINAQKQLYERFTSDEYNKICGEEMSELYKEYQRRVMEIPVQMASEFQFKMIMSSGDLYKQPRSSIAGNSILIDNLLNAYGEYKDACSLEKMHKDYMDEFKIDKEKEIIKEYRLLIDRVPKELCEKKMKVVIEKIDDLFSE